MAQEARDAPYADTATIVVDTLSKVMPQAAQDKSRDYSAGSVLKSFADDAQPEPSDEGSDHNEPLA